MSTRIGAELRPRVRPLALGLDLRLRARLESLLAGRGWLVVPFGGAVASRLYSTYLLHVAARLRHLPLFGPTSVTARWDAGWYIEIARRGYHAAPLQATATAIHHDYAFFPLWPIAIRIASLPGIDPSWAAALLSPTLFVIAAVLIALALEPIFGRAVAVDGTLLLSFSPGAWTLSMGYSEALFLVIAALAFLSTSPGRRGLAVMLAVLSRISGAGLVAVDGLRFVVSRGRDVGAFSVAVLGAGAFAAWWIVVAAISHDPLGFLHGSPEWASTTGIAQVIDVVRRHQLQRLGQLFVYGLVAVGGVAVLRRHWRMGVYTLVTLALALLPGGYVSSMPRYALAAFPGFAGLSWLAGRRGTIILIALSAAGQAMLVAASFNIHGMLAP
jgi:hypothetical protein